MKNLKGMDERLTHRVVEARTWLNNPEKYLHGPLIPEKIRVTIGLLVDNTAKLETEIENLQE